MSEVAKAAERMSSLTYRGMGEWRTLDGKSLDQDDVNELRAELAAWALPLWDETAVDESTLNAFGYDDQSPMRCYKRFVIFAGIEIEAQACAGPKCWNYRLVVGGRTIKTDPTLGDLRRLAALGIPLKEPAEL